MQQNDTVSSGATPAQRRLRPGRPLLRRLQRLRAVLPGPTVPVQLSQLRQTEHVLAHSCSTGLSVGGGLQL